MSTPVPAARVRVTKAGVVLLVIDLQGKLCSMTSDSVVVLRNVGRMIDACGVLSVPVLYTEHCPEKIGNTTEMSDISAKLKAAKAIGPIVKRTCSCTDCPGFPGALGTACGASRRTVLVCGIESHVCVCQTTLELLQLGYNVHVVSDAVSSVLKSDKKAALQRMRDAGAVVSSTQMALFELQNKCDEEEFRHILKISK